MAEHVHVWDDVHRWLCDCCDFRWSFDSLEAAEEHERKNGVRIDDDSWQAQEDNDA